MDRRHRGLPARPRPVIGRGSDDVDRVQQPFELCGVTGQLEVRAAPRGARCAPGGEALDRTAHRADRCAAAGVGGERSVRVDTPARAAGAVQVEQHRPGQSARRGGPQLVGPHRQHPVHHHRHVGGIGCRRGLSEHRGDVVVEMGVVVEHQRAGSATPIGKVPSSPTRVGSARSGVRATTPPNRATSRRPDARSRRAPASPRRRWRCTTRRRTGRRSSRAPRPAAGRRRRRDPPARGAPQPIRPSGNIVRTKRVMSARARSAVVGSREPTAIT